MSGGVFTNIHVSNGVNADAVNEKVFSKELGAGYHSQYFAVNLNLYHTNWDDRATIRSIDSSNPERGSINLQGVNALHTGVELEATAKPINNLEIKGMVSIGDWRWNSNPTGYCYNRESQAVDRNGNIVEEFSPEHASMTLTTKGVHIGNSAQSSASLGASYKLFGNFKIGFDAIYYGRNYAYYSIPANFGENKIEDPWQIPDVVLFDAHANYAFKIGGLDASVGGVVNNVFDTAY